MSYSNQPQYGQAQHWPEASQATMILVFGILGIVVCGLFSPVAWVMGNKEIAAIDAGLRPPDQRSTANIGRILGIVGSIIILLAFLVIVVAILLAVASSA